MIAVACAIIEHQGKVLVTQRGLHKAEGGLWEFPGGKLEAGENPEICIVREIREELNLLIHPREQLNASDHLYPGKTIRLIPVLCDWVSGSLQLHEHAAYQWLLPEELPTLAWCPADVPVIETYRRWLAQGPP
jgi:8-oxo-dGTP diphosphatase